jgi:hypothetical protein
VDNGGQQGPVGQPVSAAGDPHGPTPFTFTTTDANGDTIEVTSTFVPSFPATVSTNIPATGTVLGYSDWLSMIGTATSIPGASSSGARKPLVEGTALCAAVVSLIIGMLGGTMAVFP